MNEQFYLVLPSNSLLNIFQENKTSSYKVQLPYLLEMDITKWEVALSEIQFPNNFYTIRDGRSRITKQYLSPSRDDLNYLNNNVEGKWNKEELEKIRNAAWKQDYVCQESIEVLPGIYDNTEQILSQIRNGELKNIWGIDYYYHPITQKVYINLVENCRLDLNNSDVGYCLGYHPDEVLSAAKHDTSQNTAKWDLYHTCYVYTDIVQNQLVGDVKAPLLRVVLVKEGKLTYVHYDRQHFFPINRSNIAVVELNIRDEKGDFFHFNQEPPS